MLFKFELIGPMRLHGNGSRKIQFTQIFFPSESFVDIVKQMLKNKIGSFICFVIQKRLKCLRFFCVTYFMIESVNTKSTLTSASIGFPFVQ